MINLIKIYLLNPSLINNPQTLRHTIREYFFKMNFFWKFEILILIELKIVHF